jgi:hypothetical protein
MVMIPLSTASELKKSEGRCPLQTALEYAVVMSDVQEIVHVVEALQG